jgi:hypothetical protein
LTLCLYYTWKGAFFFFALGSIANDHQYTNWAAEFSSDESANKAGNAGCKAKRMCRLTSVLTYRIQVARDSPNSERGCRLLLHQHISQQTGPFPWLRKLQ